MEAARQETPHHQPGPLTHPGLTRRAAEGRRGAVGWPHAAWAGSTGRAGWAAPAGPRRLGRAGWVAPREEVGGPALRCRCAVGQEEGPPWGSTGWGPGFWPGPERRRGGSSMCGSARGAGRETGGGSDEPTEITLRVDSPAR